MRRALLFVAVLVTVAAAACGSDDDGGGESSATTAGGAATTAGGAATTAGAPAGDCVSTDGPEVVVEASEFQFSPTCVVVTATQSLVVKNVGSAQHTATIDTLIDSEFDPGGQIASEPALTGMAPGTYELYCRFHKDSYGMVAEVQITA